MASYFDSSLFLAAMLGQSGAEAFAKRWDQEPVKLSSLLIETESVTAIRRLASTQTTSDPVDFISENSRLLYRHLPALTVKPVDDEVVARLNSEVRLGGCRTLDAIHLATALLYQDHSDEPIVVCSNDTRMRTVALKLGFHLFP